MLTHHLKAVVEPVFSVGKRSYRRYPPLPTRPMIVVGELIFRVAAGWAVCSETNRGFPSQSYLLMSVTRTNFVGSSSLRNGPRKRSYYRAIPLSQWTANIQLLILLMKL